MLSYQKTLDALSQIKNDKGSELKFSDMERLIDCILQSKVEHGPENKEVIENLKKVKSEMQSIRSDVCEGLDGKCDTFDLLPLSQKDLADVLKVLDGATNSILDQTDNINSLLAADNLDRAAIGEAVIKICESCNFQDLTGQRLTRIMQNLARFEGSVSAILNAIIGENLKNRGDRKLEYANDSLMNGPEFLEEAPKQKNIDDIFES